MVYWLKSKTSAYNSELTDEPICFLDKEDGIRFVFKSGDELTQLLEQYNVTVNSKSNIKVKIDKYI